MKCTGWSSFSLCFVTLLASLGIGCGGASSKVSGSPAVTPSGGTTTASGQLTANPVSVKFGNVQVDGSSSQNVILTNSGKASVAVTSASTSGPGFRLSGLSLPLDIAAGRTVSFAVSFNPSNSGVASGAVQLNTTATSPIMIALGGTGTDPWQHSVNASWSASVSPVDGYNVYRSSQSGGPYSKINSSVIADTAYTDSLVSAGGTYFYVVTAVDTNSVESSFSNEARATVPTP